MMISDSKSEVRKEQGASLILVALAGRRTEMKYVFMKSSAFFRRCCCIVAEGYYRVYCESVMKYSFVVTPKHLGIVFKRCFDLIKENFLFISDCVLEELYISCELDGELHYHSP